MIATIPPLWRDVDAYNQIARNPLLATYWGHAPAYCYAAKVPLFLGEQMERWRGITAARAESGLSQLTDTGVGLLIIAQHLALCGAAFYFILAISKFFWVRLALALTWASNALLYTFAHCVGSETPSVILIVLVVGKGLRLIQCRREPRWIDWYVFAIALWLCLLSRHVNYWLILLLPATFGLCWIQKRMSDFLPFGDRQRRWIRQLGARYLRQAVIATTIGIACVSVANSLTHGLARETKFHPHSRIGFTFLWRLHFLRTLPPPSRAALLQKVAGRTHSKEARQLIALLEHMHKGEAVDAGAFMQRAIPLLFPLETVVPWKRLDVALNQMAFAFLLPPTPEHLHVARTEFVAGLKMPATEISSQLFNATTYFFQHRDEMPASAQLVTFRHTTADQIWIPFQHLYFQLWRDLTYNKALVLWFVSLLVFVVVARRKKISRMTISAFGIALVAVGMLMFASTCLLGEFLPRYALPMWQLLLLSLYTLIGGTADLLARTRFRAS